MNVLLTQSLPNVYQLAEKLTPLTINPIIFPTFSIEPLSPPAQSLPPAHAFIFQSQHAVRLAKPWIQPPVTVDHWLAIGPQTAQALQEHFNVKAQYPTPPYESESLLATAPLQAPRGKSIWIFKGVGGRQLLINTLEQQGACVNVVNLYERIPTQNALPKTRPTLIVTTSHDALKNLATLSDPAFKTIPIVVVGKRMVDLAKHLGFQQPIMAAQADHLTIIKVIETVKDQL